MPIPPDATLADVGEFGLIASSSRCSRRGSRCSSAPATTRPCCGCGPGTWSSRPTCSSRAGTSAATGPSAADVGHRAAAQNLSDINAMGGRATSLTIGLAAPRGPARPVGAGLRRAASPTSARWSAPRRRRRPHPGRPGRDRGDRARRLHAVAGAPLGRRARRRARDRRAAGLGRRRAGRARPRLPLARGCWSRPTGAPQPPYDAGRVAAEAGATAMIDVSDGLLADAGHLAAGSGVAIDVHTAAFDDPRAAAGRRAPRPAPTRSRSSSAAATTTPCSRPSSPSPPSPRAGR